MNYSIFQLAIFDLIQNETGSVMIQAVAGSGKCLGYDTHILMFDGSIKMSQNISVGDQVMGPDSMPRNVLSTNVGFGKLFRITPIKGDSWICNDVHILTLVESVSGEVFDIALNDYISNNGSKKFRNSKLFRVAVEYPEREIVLDPYFAGLWLGDGSIEGPMITSQDVEIHNYLVEYAKVNGLIAKINFYKKANGEEKCPSIRISLPGGKSWGKGKGVGISVGKTSPGMVKGGHNSIRDELIKFVINAEKRIPQNYLVNSVENRLKLLAGLIDSDGYWGTGYYEISTKWAGLKDDILHLCRGLGFAAYAKLRTKKIKSTGFEGKYWVISISGDGTKIPVLLARKKATPRLQKKNVLRTGFSATDIGEGNYYGFTLDGDGRFLLGDYTVTHNTTTIVEACKRLRSDLSVLFIAFNKAIVEELKTKLPSHINCATFNSCGWGAWRKTIGKNYMKIDTKKTWNIIWDKFSEDDQFHYGAFVNKLVALAKSSGLRPEDSNYDWLAVIDHHCLELTTKEADIDRAIDLSKKTLGLSIQQANVICDFDDQIYMPFLRNSNFEKYDCVFVDEAQDTNALQKNLLSRMLKPGGRLIAVGDFRQAIYGFRGAGSDSMSEIQKEFNAISLPLSISYRCCKSVIREAQKYAPEIMYFEGADEGKVETLVEYDINTFGEEDAILCRNNAPLVKMAYSIITRGKPVNFAGRDIGAGLKNLIKQMDAESISDLSIRLDTWKNREIEKFLAKKQEEKIEALEDRVNCIEIFISYLSENNQTITGLIAAIDSLFEGSDKGITLSSVHKSKGREWNRVFILDFHLMPSKWASKRDWMMTQENNLIYVAITRAKKYLGYVVSDAWTDAPDMSRHQVSVTAAKEATPVKGKTKVAGKSGVLKGFRPNK